MLLALITRPYHLPLLFLYLFHIVEQVQDKFVKLKIPLCKTKMSQKAISFVGPSLWNSLPELIKKMNNLNNFKRNVKKYYLS